MMQDFQSPIFAVRVSSALALLWAEGKVRDSQLFFFASADSSNRACFIASLTCLNKLAVRLCRQTCWGCDFAVARTTNGTIHAILAKRGFRSVTIEPTGNVRMIGPPNFC
jgi:hypothetical protein